jgi:hypothetical protein
MDVSDADVLFFDTQIRRGWHREDFTAEELILVPEGMDAGRARAAVSASRRAGSKRFSTGAKAVELAEMRTHLCVNSATAACRKPVVGAFALRKRLTYATYSFRAPGNLHPEGD